MVWLVIALGCSSSGTDPGSDTLPADDSDLPPVETDTEVDTETDPVDTVPSDVPCARYVPPTAAPSRLSAGSLRPQRFADFAHPGHCHVIEDLDGDGYVDLVFGDDEAVGGARLVWMWGLPGGDHDVVIQPIGAPVDQCIAWDHDGDGALELLFVERDALRVMEGLPERAPAASTLLQPVDGLSRSAVFSMALVALDGVTVDDLMIAVGGEANVCLAPEVDPEGDDNVILPSDPIAPGEVLCLLKDGDGWRQDDGTVCPSVLRPTPTSFPFALSLQDLDDDGFPEVLATGDFAPNVMVKRDASGLWSDISGPTGFGGYNHAMGVAWADLDLDGLRDAWVTDYGPDQLRWNQGCLTFFEAEQRFGVAALTAQTITWEVVAADLDHDGDEDVVVAQSMEVPEGRLNESVCALERAGLPVPPLMVMANDGAGSFVRHDVPGPSSGTATPQPNHLTAGDVDGDGAIDLLNTDKDYGTTLLRNRTSGRGHYVVIRPVDAVGSAAWGARVVVDDGAGERVRELHLTTSTTGQGPAVAHVGLGAHDGVVTARIRWPDGTWTTHEGLAVDQLHTIGR